MGGDHTNSGGHMAWAGANSIEDGVTIDLGLLTTTTYHPETKTASLQPGGRWTQVYEEVEKRRMLSTPASCVSESPHTNLVRLVYRWSHGSRRP